MSAAEKRTPREPAEASAEENTPNTAILAPAVDSGNVAIDRITDRLELAGFAVHQLEGDGFLVTRWGLCKHCPDPRALSGFAEQVGA